MWQREIFLARGLDRGFAELPDGQISGVNFAKRSIALALFKDYAI